MRINSLDEPTYRLVIPSNQMAVINLYFPRYKLYKYRGHGTYTSKPTVEEFRYGTIKTTTMIEANLKDNPNDGFAALSDICRECDKRALPSIAFDAIEYQDVELEGRLANLRFEKDTVLAAKMKGLVMNGRFPKQQLYEMLQAVKTELHTEEDLSPQVLRRWRASCLMLKTCRPDNSIMHDLKRIQSLWRAFMFLIQDVGKGWTLYDVEARRFGKAF